MKPVNIGQTLSEIIGGLTEEYGHKGLTLSMKQPVPDTIANVDTALLRRVIVNILENSVKYKTADSGALFVLVRNENGDIVIRLADDGPGVPTDKLHKLFDVFYRADPSRNTKGSGLGLAISAKIIKQMGGGIAAELTVSGGLAIVLRLPSISDEGSV
jgi:K+-sensing histidine kinase KdpD